MRFGGNFAQNLNNAVKSRDIGLQKDILLDEVAQLIEEYPMVVYGLLKKDGATIPKDPTKKQLIDATVDNLQTNILFRRDMPLLIVANKSGKLKREISSGANGETYSNAGVFDDVGGFFKDLVSGDDGGSNVIENVGGGATDGAKTGGFWGGLIGTLGGVTESVFDYKSSQNAVEIANQQAKTDLYNKLLGNNDTKTNWMPIIVIGGVLLLGSVVVFMTLKAKK